MTAWYNIVKSIGETVNMYCNQCGKQLVENSKFCSYCGAKVGYNTEKSGIYRFEFFSLDKNVPEDKLIIDKITPLLKSVLGYTQDEIDKFEKQYFSWHVADNLNFEQVKMIAQPFCDIGVGYIVSEVDDTGMLIKNVRYVNSYFNITPQQPKEHYYDEPVVGREHLIDPFNPPIPKKNVVSQVPVISCPYCHSTNVHKLDNRHMDIIGGNLIGGNLAQLGKNFHCNKCGADF